MRTTRPSGPVAQTPPRPSAPELVVVWSGALERQGEAPTLSSPLAGSGLGAAVATGATWRPPSLRASRGATS